MRTNRNKAGRRVKLERVPAVAYLKTIKMEFSMRFRLIKPVFLIAAFVALAGCQDVRNAVGIERTVPDEFAVAAPVPLIIPPDFNLRPPAPGSQRAQASSEERARTALVGRAKMRALQQQGMTIGEAQLLTLAGSANVPPDIRATLDKEVSSFAREETAFTDRLVFWREGGQASLGGTALDPAAEMRRLNQNAAEGRDANEGPIPVITRSGSSALSVF